jgi:hypothetical protein
VPKNDTFAFGVNLHDVNKFTVAAVEFDVKRHVTEWSMEEILTLGFCIATRRRMEKARLQNPELDT